MTLFEAVSVTLRRLHYSPRTEEAYLRWVREFVRFHNRRHPREMGAAEVTAFLNDLAVRRHTSASTQNQALCALVFLYRRVLEMEVSALEGLQRARRPDHLPPSSRAATSSPCSTTSNRPSASSVSSSTAPVSVSARRSACASRTGTCQRS